LKHADFMKVVERLHGPLDENCGDRSQRMGGLWNEIVQPRPSVLHDLSAEDRAVFKFLLRGDEEYRPVDTMETVTTLVDLDYSTRRNFARHKLDPWHLSADGKLCNGTMHNGGAWIVRASSDRRLKGTVVDGHYRRQSEITYSVPLGMSRRADRESGKYCLVTGEDSTDDERRLAGKVLAMLEEVKENGVEATTEMPPMDFIVVTKRKLTLRASDETFADCARSRRSLMIGISSATSTGRWGIPGVPNMSADMVGTVASVDGFDVTVTDGNQEKTYTFDPAEANRIASERTGFDLPYVEPIVRSGQKVMPGTALYGPWPVQRVNNPNDIPAMVSKLGGNLELALAQVQSWFILTQAKQLIGEQLGYPIEFVVPQSLGEVRVRVDSGPHVIAGPAENRRGRYGRNLTPVRNLVKKEGIGYAIDLYVDAAHHLVMQAVERQQESKAAKAKARSAANKKATTKRRKKAKRTSDA